ncbi:hypothetical protein [Micromonospora sp. NPDC003816]|uniref:hypothetical protein n=1 Tax=Micromonospora sp. NPDC003816 TaxID=3364224 RepID=UPI0036877EDB
MIYQPPWRPEIVSDEALYVRLLRLNEGFPRDFGADDYDQRRDAWEAQIFAITNEIQRQGAEPPTWWGTANGFPNSPRHRYRRLTVTLAFMVYAGACALAIALFGGPAIAITFWGTVLGGGAALFIATRVADRRATRRR